jgi:hypothetical protein
VSGVVLAFTTRAIPRMMSGMMSQMMQNMMSEMGGGDCDPAAECHLNGDTAAQVCDPGLVKPYDRGLHPLT